MEEVPRGNPLISAGNAQLGRDELRRKASMWEVGREQQNELPRYQMMDVCHGQIVTLQIMCHSGVQCYVLHMQLFS
ncbi:hypothetical protein J6590_017019 [Homalodisca vitripennis]|nr:hypothetical protein J6590_017019 [Homalodisca vitripennis]